MTENTSPLKMTSLRLALIRITQYLLYLSEQRILVLPFTILFLFCYIYEHIFTGYVNVQNKQNTFI